MDNYVIIASLRSESTGKLINRISDLRLLVSSLPGSDSRTHVESLGKPRDSTSILKALSGKLDINRHSPWYSLCIIHDIVCNASLFT